MSEMKTRVENAILLCINNSRILTKAETAKFAAALVIDVMRQPTEAMLHAAMATHTLENRGIEHAPMLSWRAMIDEALK